MGVIKGRMDKARELVAESIISTLFQLSVHRQKQRKGRKGFPARGQGASLCVSHCLYSKRMRKRTIEEFLVSTSEKE